MKRFYGIVGPESSGTKIITALFVKAGCFGDGPQHEQRIDKVISGSESLESIGIKPENDIVLRRSVPYGASWPDLIVINNLFVSKGYQPLWIILLRDWTCNVQSKIKQNHKKDKDTANRYLFEEIKVIFKQVLSMNVPFYVLNTSLLFERKRQALIRLEEITGLSFDCSDIYNADEQYIYKKTEKKCEMFLGNLGPYGN